MLTISQALRIRHHCRRSDAGLSHSREPAHHATTVTAGSDDDVLLHLADLISGRRDRDRHYPVRQQRRSGILPTVC